MNSILAALGLLRPPLRTSQPLDNSALGFRPPTAEEIANHPAWKDMLTSQQALKGLDATQGELGLIVHPGGSVSHEISVGVPNPLGQGEVNIPTLVQGQSPDSILRILFGQMGPKEVRTAARRASERVRAGARLPIYANPEEADKAAILRESRYNK